MRVLITTILVSGLIALSACTQPSSTGQVNTADDFSCANDPSWTTPQEPLRIYGNTWYVGPRGLTVLLITAPTGDVLIDGGVPGHTSLIEANIQNLGIHLRDIKWILNSHAHCDHAGGIAQLAHDTGAQVIANAEDTPLLARGGHDDPEYGDRFRFPPVDVSRSVTDGESLHLGNLVLTAYSTPGHTKGNTTWTWTSCEGGRCLHMVDIGSLSAPDFKLIGNPKYPDVVKDFESSFAKVAALSCDIALGPHPEMVNFWERVTKREQGDADALIDPTGCRAYAADARENFEAQLAKQRADAALKK
ncbi:subclass B3 metallo-beta-lactamase [Dyella caseinilytica]|uniref:Subclass B3 metallo-beta-lactamase n=1 Tax=Dyella caseinilytica TaxID=1849581 RepID=A0ABX7GQ65_9GAMM|nr:subclass B3 metallo-beta-lactamase [Dyella caseinilytica]QRN51972.1 subclass B3 metallo-beta-lactamase [Dyella caseinilytica]GGA04033.1 subclass B3 metallo-beta-lactamase BJP-1 [Dyella caseinilytica]